MFSGNLPPHTRRSGACFAVTVLALILYFVFSSPVAAYVCGDSNGDGKVNVGDCVFIITHVFKGGAAPVPIEAGDANGDGTVNIGDAVYLINTVFKEGPPARCPLDAMMVGYTGCKTFEKSGLSTSYLDCVEWSFDGAGTLTLKHVNAGFNCCPDFLYAGFTIEDNRLIIDEHESLEVSGGCACLCLFDVDYTMANVGAGEWTIRINGMYLLPDDPVLEFTVQLTSEPSSGTFCVTRGYYPWDDGMGEPSVPVIGECKTLGKDQSGVEDQDCIEYYYNGDGVLVLSHINALFNCCPDRVVVEVDFAGDEITVREIEIAANPCDCMCLYDFSYAIANIEPGEYTLRIIQPHFFEGSEMLEFQVSLGTEPSSGTFCVDRPYLPWSE